MEGAAGMELSDWTTDSLGTAAGDTNGVVTVPATVSDLTGAAIESESEDVIVCVGCLRAAGESIVLLMVVVLLD